MGSFYSTEHVEKILVVRPFETSDSRYTPYRAATVDDVFAWLSFDPKRLEELKTKINS